ncbi:hypothetical protein M422DRAFT_253293 [Sphaerobolus stellatus SS14]|uniref:Unplaced genomic scaffold SPHSTscaffold_48, whole genome shotgun sequence n=1 Tax=Sphaerobolus stellatus (strain SS14) TaxID=990650 RepID=A0A0C9VNA1_SPHS4|nr:hypothetical protein M422DRAFT_253293 [Sphaerobolus stellatus SS14]
MNEDTLEIEFSDMLFVVESEDEGENIGMQGGSMDFEEEISSEDALQNFVKTLQEAQQAAQMEEKQRNRSRRCPKYYTDNSIRSKYHWAAKRRELAADGQTQFITQFFREPKDAATRSLSCSPETVSEGSVTGNKVDESLSEMTLPQGQEEFSRQSEVEVEVVNTPTANDKPQKLLHDLCDYTLETATDKALDKLDWHNLPALLHIQAELTVKSKDKKIDVFF